MCGILKEAEKGTHQSEARRVGGGAFRGAGGSGSCEGIFRFRLKAGAGGKAGRQQRWGADKSHGGLDWKDKRSTGWVSKLLSHLSPWGTASI